MKIERWFKGAASCGPSAPMQEDGDAMAQCLWTQITYVGLGHETARLAEIIRRHFGGREVCEMCQWSDLTFIIHTNNSPATTREDVDKILRIFSEEMERA